MANTQNKKSSGNKKKVPSNSKSASNKKPAASAEVSSAVKRQKSAIILMAVAVFIAAVVLIPGESVWLAMHDGMFGLFGFCAFVVPAVLIYLAIVLAKDKTVKSVAANVAITVAAVALLSGAVHIFANSDEFLHKTMAEQFTGVWGERPSLASGGIFGAIFGGLVAKLFGKVGAAITFVLLTVVIIMLLTGTTLGGLFNAIKKPVKKVSDITNEKLEQNALRREQEELEREEAEKEKEKKRFSPPVKPTASADSFEDNFITDETTFAPVDEEPVIPDIPVVTLPDPTHNDIVDEIIESAIKEEKKKPRTKFVTPSMPSDAPDEDIYDDVDGDEDEEDIPFEVLPEIEPEKPDYIFPSIELLNLVEREGSTDSMTEMQIGAKKLVSTLESFKINAEVTNICRGPSVTRYELVPEAGVRINKITGLADDIALRLAATSVRIEAPIPGKAAIGIEIPNSAKSMVSMREIIDTPDFRDAKSKLNVALGKDITGNIICADLAKMPHLLVAGTTGSGKSVCLNSMIVSILYNASPEEVKLLMIDPKMVEFTIYNGIAHLEVPVVSNPRKAAGALGWAVGEMEKRYKQFSENSVRDIKGFNKLCETRDDLVKMHHIVIFIDELSDLMMVSPKEVEDSICRLAQMARAAGIHLVIATQRPSVDVITGIIKANIPSRIALSVSSQIDSRTILDAVGAEKLLGNGDMLFNPVGASKPTRVQGCFISDAEVERVVNHIKSQAQTTYNEDTIHEIEAKAAAAENAKKKAVDEDDDEEYDPMLNDAIEVVVNAGGASTTMLQKKLKLGYARASRVMDQLEEKGIVGPSEGAKPRTVLITKQQWYEMQALADGAGAPSIDDVFADDDDYSGSDDDFV
ncbi:MAG: DNA translocase FtsK 4TM domain-containing protein [Clostridia bacterium]|nr:DNA translocase FtsK 4TM domain-containing protein [Clostridia bacterium]